MVPPRVKRSEGKQCEGRLKALDMRGGREKHADAVPSALEPRWATGRGCSGREGGDGLRQVAEAGSGCPLSGKAECHSGSQVSLAKLK